MEFEKMMHMINGPAAEYQKESLIHEIFEKQAADTPDKTAVISGDASLTYAELNKKTNQLARFLRKNGIKGDSIAGVMIPRSIDMLIAIIGILKAGGAYAPFNFKDPAERIGYILENAQIKLLLTTGEFANKIGFGGTTINIDNPVWESEPDSNPGKNINSRNLAYVIHTSGTTGKPKGVMIEHYSVINRLNWMQKQYAIGENDMILQKTPIGFDVSVWELFLWFFAGSALCLLERDRESNPLSIIETIHRYKISVMHFVPSMLDLFLDYCSHRKKTDMTASLKKVFASGEKLQATTLQKFNSVFRDYDALLYNLYGPTEATVDVTYFDCPKNTAIYDVPIGRPIDNTSVYILDSEMNLCPAGEPGEIYLGGDCLARGYINNRELTDEKFVKNPFLADTRMYKTGDIGKWLPDGNIEYIGRIDNQIKIRGHRIELEEIENVINTHPDVDLSVVLLKEKPEKFLYAFLKLKKQGDIREIRIFLGKKIPDYMVPDEFSVIDSFPLTGNGKIDRKKLIESLDG